MPPGPAGRAELEVEVDVQAAPGDEGAIDFSE